MSVVITRAYKHILRFTVGGGYGMLVLEVTFVGIWYIFLCLFCTFFL
jgi:hypothetical protein